MSDAMGMLGAFRVQLSVAGRAPCLTGIAV